MSTVSTRSALRSAARGNLVVPHTRRRVGNRAFSVAGPAAWNSLPPDIRTASTLCTFKKLLKTHLFLHSFRLLAGGIQQITAFIRRCIRQGYCNADHADITSIINTADDTLFRQILTNPNHVLAHLLPEKVNQLRPRQHDRQLIPKTTKLYSCNFVIRMLYKRSYGLYFIVHSLTVLITFLLLSYIVQVAF